MGEKLGGVVELGAACQQAPSAFATSSTAKAQNAVQFSADTKFDPHNQYENADNLLPPTMSYEHQNRLFAFIQSNLLNASV